MLFLRERYRNNQMMEMMRSFMEEVAERQAFLEALNRLTEAIAQNGRGGQ